MAISLEQYRVAIGVFCACGNKKKLLSDLYFWSFIYPNFFFYHWVLPNILRTCGDIEVNPGPSKSNKALHIGHANVRSLTSNVDDPLHPGSTVSKFDLVKNHILFYKYDLFGISETWIDNSVSDDKISVPGYKVFRCDFSRHQRGVLVYVSKFLPAKRRKDLEQNGVEIICIECQIGQIKILICNCYRVPDFDVIDYCSAIDDILDSTASEFNDIIFMGDMNARNSIFWNFDITNTEGRVMHSYFQSKNFEQLIHEPTRIVGESKSCIDLLFSTNPCLFSEVGVRDKIVDVCDHSPIFAVLKFSYSKPECYKRWVWNFEKGNFDLLRQLILDAPWHSCYVDRNVHLTVQNWMDLLLKLCESAIPHYETTIRPGDKDFMTSDIRKLMRERDRLRREKNITRDPTVVEEYKYFRNMVVSEIRIAEERSKAKRNKEISCCNVTSKRWWRLCKESLGSVSVGADSPIMDNGKIITDNKHKAELFNQFFVDQSTLDDSNAHLPPDLPQSVYNIDQLVVQPENVYMILSKLDPSKATGPDGLGNRILREAAVPLAQPLSELFNFCLSLGHFPDIWKMANVMPLFKKDDPLLCNNYRPISLLPCISKVFEKILFNHIFAFLRIHNLIIKDQSGFMPGDSTVNQLIAICNSLYKCVDQGDEMLAVFLDLTKAFDKVWHKGLLFKLSKIGIHGKLFDLLESYLSNRKQCVQLCGCTSSSLELKAGVPQGSVLGPLLFLIYINDISDDLKSKTYLFADDTSLFQTIKDGDTRSAANVINRDLDLINKWASKWLISINHRKTIVMLFSRKRSPCVLPEIKLGNTVLSQVEQHKHLGAILAQDLSWSSHIQSVVAKSNKRLGLMKRFKYLWSRKSLEKCYMSFIRPVIEYGNILYDNCTKEDHDNLENVQLEAARIVTGGKKRTSHDKLYRELGWLTLSVRRLISKLVKFYDIVNDNAPSYLKDIIQPYMLSHTHGRTTRGSVNLNFMLPEFHKNVYKNFYVYSTILSWNNLSSVAKTATSKLSFKHNLLKSFVYPTLLFNHKTERHLQVAFTQIRMDFSNLRSHLKSKHCIDDDICQCGTGKEDARHYFFHCNKYIDIRRDLFTKIRSIDGQSVTLPTLLYGNKNLSNADNMLIFSYVYDYIDNSGRFSNM